MEIAVQIPEVAAGLGPGEAEAIALAEEVEMRENWEDME